jgi:hypothetical protein
MEILIWKKTEEKDLHIGLQVCYNDQSGNFTKLGIITDILERKPHKEYLINTSFGSYTAIELKLIKTA